MNVPRVATHTSILAEQPMICETVVGTAHGPQQLLWGRVCVPELDTGAAYKL